MNLESLIARVYDRLDEDPSDPQRWPESVVTEYLNDGIQLFSSRARMNVTSTTIQQRPETLYYNLPADCIAVLAIYDDMDDALALTSWREFDRTQIPGGRLPESIGRLKARWVRGVGTRATHAYTFGMKELVLWPMIGPATITDEVFLSDELEGDDATLTLELSAAPTSMGVWWNGTRLEEVASSPSPNEYSFDGTTVTLGTAPSTGDIIQTFISKSSVVVLGETPSGTLDGSNQTFTITGTPSDSMNVAVYHNGSRLINVSDIYEAAEGGSVTFADGTFYVSGSTITITVFAGSSVRAATAPQAGDYLRVDYTTDDTDVILGEVPDGELDGVNTEFVLDYEPADFNDVAVFHSGIRLRRAASVPGNGEYTIAGRIIRLGLIPDQAEGIFVDYVRVPEAANKDYTLHYLRDIEDDLDYDSDAPTLPTTFHEHLVEYAVARCLLPKARGKRIQRAVEGLNKFSGRVEQARYHNRNVHLDNAVDSYGPTP